MAAMDTDEQQNTPQTNLRRSNSAPLINGANLTEANISYPSTVTPRNRRSSTSQMANGNPYSAPVGSPHSRLLQIRKEEFIDETEQDRMVNTSLFLSSSCESLMMNHPRRNLYSPSSCDDRRHSIDDPTNYFPSSTASSPSPTTRNVTPSLPRLIPRSRSLTPSPIPSPTRQVSRRSSSPVLKQSTLSYKRKFFPDGVDVSMQSPAKKAFHEPMQHSSSDETCETTNSHINNDDDSGIETTTPTTPVTSMLFCDTSHPKVSYYRPKYTPPRSPLARSLSSNSNEEINKRYSLDGTNCFTFAPVQD